VTHIISGGKLGGLLQFRAEMLDPAMNSLGQIAVTLGTLVNQQHAEGLDLNGDFGTDLFTLGGARALASTLNAGGAAMSVTRTDVSAVTTADYQMRFNGTAWTMTRADSGAAVAMTGAGTVANPFVAEGLSIVVSGSAAAGDAFLVQPTRDAVSGLRVAISDPEKIAAAAALLTGAATANSGSGAIGAGKVTNPAGWVRGSYTLRFTAANAWQVTDAANAVVATGAYTAGGNIDFNGMRVSVTGAPAAGDQFTIADNSIGGGDNRNARALADLFDRPVINGNTVSLSGSVGRLIGQIGVQTNQAQIGRDAQSVVLEDASAAVQSISGVNLDEEAAALVRYQQAYQAAARVIAAASSMFDTLIEATRR
jgi:flagellar hook-associated protein 1 FlgK